MCGFLQLMGKFYQLVSLLFQLLLLAGKFPVQAILGTERFIHDNQQSDDQQQDDKAPIQHHLLRGHPRKIRPYPAVERLDFSIQLADMGCLQFHHVRIYRVDYCCLQFCLPFKRFLLQNIHRQLNHLVSFGGINEGSIQHAVQYQFHSVTLAGQSIDTYKQHLLLTSQTSGSLISTGGHTVVHPIHGINLQKTLQEGIHLYFGRLPQPTRIFPGKQGDARIPADGTHKALVTFDGRSGTDKSAQFDYFSAPLQAMGYVIADGFAQLVIVGSDVCGIFIGKYPAIHHNHRNTSIESFLHNGSESHSLVGSHNKQVYLLPDEVTYIFYLSPAVVIRRTRLYLYASVK